MTRGYSLGRREAGVAQTRAAIMRALLRLMARRAYDSITIKEIAREADVAERTVHRHFRSKDAIFVARAEEAVAGIRTNLEESTQGHGARCAVQRLVRALYGEYEEHNQEIWAFVTAEANSAEMAEFGAAARGFGDSLAASVVDAWPGAWRFDQERTRHILAGLLRFLAWRVMREECGLSPEEAVQAMTEITERILMRAGVGGEEGAVARMEG